MSKKAKRIATSNANAKSNANVSASNGTSVNKTSEIIDIIDDTPVLTQDYVDAAVELNDALGLDPEIEVVDTTDENLRISLIAAATLIDLDSDDVSVLTLQILKSLGAKIKAPIVPAKKKGAIRNAAKVDMSTLLSKEIATDDDEDDLDVPVEKKAKGEKKSNTSAEKKPGVIATIAYMLENSGRRGVSKEEILEALVIAFPDNAEKSMKNTINVQVPSRISKEKFQVVHLKSGRYRKATEEEILKYFPKAVEPKITEDVTSEEDEVNEDTLPQSSGEVSE